MRKIAIEIFYWMDNWADDQIAYFQRAKDCGFEGVEISFVAGPEAIDVNRMRGELDRLGLDVYCSTGLGAETDISHPDAAVRQAGIAYLRKCLETAKQLQSSLLGGVTYAPWLLFPDGNDLHAHRERSAAALHEVGKIAADLDIILTMEILNRFETFMFNTVDEGLHFLEQVNHPNIKLQLDTYHMNMEEDSIPDAIRKAGTSIGHFHCAASNRKLPGRGHIDWVAVASALNATDYDGALIIETFPNPDVETGRTVNTWRPLVSAYDEEAKSAAEFLRQHFG
ncbi:MAG: sugar phosphate isomerase/epimerase family protein [Anaerolineae bacterium]|nr:sugar phosphate isomerase/epimerase family protein [Anaerolineae bacterium]